MIKACSRINLFMDKDLCILPFVGLYIRADGNIYPCETVAWQSDLYCLGNLESCTLEEAWNAPAMKRLRLKVLNTGTCELATKQKNSCTYLLNHDLYKDSYNTFKEKIKDDGSYPFELQTLFLARSNLCNLKCIYCCEKSSTVWENETGIITKKISDEIYDEKLSPYLVNLKELFLSGGEPVLHPYNFKILKFLKKANPNLQLGMATNLTYNFEKYKEFFELFSSFNNSKIYCSVDLGGEQFEAIRINSKWSTVEANLIELKKLNVRLYLNSVITILNVPYIKKFHKDMIDKNILDVDSIRYLTLKGPECLNIQNLPEDKKREYNVFLISYIAFLRFLEIKKINVDTYPNNKLPSTAIELIKKYMYEVSDLPKTFNYKNEITKYVSKEILERLFAKAL